jgi:hypothetical protein
MLLHIFLNTLKDSLGITGLVILIMIIIESLNIESKGYIFDKLKKTKFGQILVSAILGAIPGCVGGFASVSLYSHRMISFGALVAMMVATAGDESFMMIAMFPKKAAFLFTILFILAIISGVSIDAVSALRKRKNEKPAFKIEFNENDNYEVHECDCEHHEDHKFKHFITEHLWGHIIKKHLPKIFCWTFGVLFVFGLLQHYVDINSWISNNTPVMILLAMLIGLIPQSGPHMIFVTLFASGLIPFPVLLANSIVQDGHAGIPLLADNKKSFVYAKLFKCALALVVCGVALIFFK